MLRELISRFTGPGSPPPVLSQVSQLSQSQRPGILLANPSTVAKVATVAVAKVENPKIGATAQPAVECKGASAPGPDTTGLGWLPGPPDDADPAFPSWWTALDLLDLGRCFGLRIVRASERILAIFPPDIDPELVAAASEALADARPFLAANLDKLPVLTPPEAVVEIKGIMREHPGLRFTRGEGGSMWPLYPKTWTAGQKATAQSLWFAAGDALDRDDFRGVE